MKKLLLAVVLVSSFSFNTVNAAQYELKETVLQEKQYKKIEVSQVSKEALDKIKKSYGNYTISEAYRADDGEYKLVLTSQGTSITATFTSAGDLLKILK